MEVRADKPRFHAHMHMWRSKYGGAHNSLWWEFYLVDKLCFRVNQSLAKTDKLWFHAHKQKTNWNLVGPVGLEPTTKGFTVAYCFQ